MSRMTQALQRAGNSTPAGVAALAPVPWVFEPATIAASPAAPAASAAPKAIVGALARSVAAPDAVATEGFEKLVLSPDLPAYVVEQYRRLGATLHAAQRDEGIRIVMVTSAVPHEGKTLVASNLALVLSTSYRKSVLLIDGDLRRPSVHTVFGLANETGIADRLDEGTADTMEPLQVTPTLSLLLAGTPQSDPMRLVTGGGMQRLLATAAGNYDWVILDTPPIGILPDAHLLASAVDRALVVIEAGRTPYDAIQKAIDTIGCERIIGTVLNRADGASAAPYGQYGYYYGPSPELDA
jgi:capsular exopolysaccharide synthesis family protein